MNTRYSFRRACTLVAVVAIAATTAHADAAESTMSIDTRAPLAVTLLPTVSIVADASNPDAVARWHVADEAPLRMTLMPTVRVTATESEIAAATRTAIASTRAFDSDAFAARTMRVAAIEPSGATEADDEVPLGLMVEPR